MSYVQGVVCMAIKKKRQFGPVMRAETMRPSLTSRAWIRHFFLALMSSTEIANPLLGAVRGQESAQSGVSWAL